MAHHAARLPACANCHYPFVPGEPAEFCPRCGQQNHAVNIGFGHVLEEFFEGVFHFDGKVFSTLKLLLFRPGELTRRFLAGQRVPYVPPIRLYVFISFVFFLLLSLTSGPSKEGKGMKVQVGQVAEARKEQGAVSIGTQLPLTKAQFDSLPLDMTTAQADSVLRRHGVVPSFQKRLVIRHMPRLMRLNQEEITHTVLKSFSIALFVLMPLSALLLLLAYWRQQRYYVSHLIFAVHLHCFVFVVLALLLGINYLPPPAGTGLMLSLVVPLYLVLALHRLYGQGWGKTIVKGLVLAGAYTLLLGAGLTLAAALGLMLV